MTLLWIGAKKMNNRQKASLNNIPYHVYSTLIDGIDTLEQEPKSEWEHDHEILKAYSDGANEVLDKIRTEIGNINLNEVAAKYEDRFYGFQREVIKIIDKYKGESKG